MATRQELEAQLAKLQAELAALREKIIQADAANNDEEEQRLLNERTRLRGQVSEISNQLLRLDVSEATSFVIRFDDQTGLLEIRTAGGAFAGRGDTLEEAKDRAIRNGARPEFLNNLVDPRAKAAADQGPGTVSAGETTAQAQEARAPEANAQNPTDQPTGNTASISNAESSQPQAPGELPQAPKLPPAQAQGASVVPTASNSSQPAPGPGVRALQGDAFGSTQQSYVYRALSCVSRFRGGQFTQDLEGTQMQFSNSQIRAVSNQVVPAGTPSAATVAASPAAPTSPAEQADVRRVDNAIAAAQTPDQSAAESARLAAAGRTPDQSSAETARLAAQAGRIAAGAAAGTPAAALGTGLVTTAAGAAGINPSLVPFTSPGATNVIGGIGAAASLTGNPQINRAAQALVPAQSFVATSLGQPVGLGQLGSTGASQSVVARTPAVTVNLIGGGTATVTTVDQALALYSQGRISLEQRDRALSQLASLAAAQQPTQTVNRQPVGYEP